MQKVKHSKNELKNQKDALKRFRRYLPMLVLKKQQLQSEIVKIHNAIESIGQRIKSLRVSVEKWIGVFGEGVGIDQLISIKNIITENGNIGGIDIPIFDKVEFDEKKYDFIKMPLWVDYGIEAIKEIIDLIAQDKVFKKQLKIIEEELRITTQRVNLFEKIKIPEAVENIRKIRIFLGDLQTAAVVTGKIAKQKLEKKMVRAA